MPSQSIKSQVYEGVLSDIMDGTYPPNTVLNEKTIVEQYKVSKTPVREALVQLCSEGVLQNIPRYGYQVTSISPSEVLEIVAFRKVIELAALEESFSHLGEKELDILRQLNEDSQKIVGLKDSRTHWRQNAEFHRTLASFCNNRYLQKALDTALNISIRISNQYFTKLWSESRLTDAANHVTLVRAIETNDLDAAKAILLEDVDSFKKEIL